MKSILIAIFLFSIMNANESEKFFWDEVKDSSDVELLQLYKKQYPNGTFEKIADLKIKRLLRSDRKKDDMDGIPTWLKGTSKYKFYGIGKANKHFKGKNHQENLARSRAQRELQSLYEENDLSNKMIESYNNELEMMKYTDKNERIYVLLYIENYNIK